MYSFETKIYGQLYHELLFSYFYNPSLNYFDCFFLHDFRTNFSVVIQFCFVKQVFIECLNLDRNLQMYSYIRQSSFPGKFSIIQSNRVRNRVPTSVVQCGGEVYTKSQETTEWKTVEHTCVSHYLRHFQKIQTKAFNIFQENKMFKYVRVVISRDKKYELA